MNPEEIQFMKNIEIRLALNKKKSKLIRRIKEEFEGETQEKIIEIIKEMV